MLQNAPRAIRAGGVDGNGRWKRNFGGALKTDLNGKDRFQDALDNGLTDTDEIIHNDPFPGPKDAIQATTTATTFVKFMTNKQVRRRVAPR